MPSHNIPVNEVLITEWFEPTSIWKMEEEHVEINESRYKILANPPNTDWSSEMKMNLSFKKRLHFTPIVDFLQCWFIVEIERQVSKFI